MIRSNRARQSRSWGGIQSRLLRGSLNLDLDQVVDLASASWHIRREELCANPAKQWGPPLARVSTTLTTERKHLGTQWLSGFRACLALGPGRTRPQRPLLTIINATVHICSIAYSVGFHPVALQSGTCGTPHFRMGFPALPQLSSAAELFIINRVAHHDPQPNAQFGRRCDPRLAHSFLDQLAPVEAFPFRVFPCPHASPLRSIDRAAASGLPCSVSPIAAVSRCSVRTGSGRYSLATALPFSNRRASPRNTSVASTVTAPTPGCVRSRSA